MAIIEENPRKGTLAEATKKYAALLQTEPNPPPDEIIPETEDVVETEESLPEEVEEDLETDSEDEDYENTDLDDTTEEQVFTVRVDGKEETVNLPELKAGYSRQSDYSRKTSALSEERKAFESVQQSVSVERQKYAELLPMLEQSLLEQAAVDKEPDFTALIRKDPQAGLVAEREWKQRKAKRDQRLQAIQGERGNFQREEQARQEAAYEKHLSSEREKLNTLVPDWANEKTAGSEQEKISEWAVKNGYLSDEELGTITSAGAIAIMRMAWQFDKGKTKAQEAKTRRQTKRGIAPGSANQTPPNRSERQMRQKLKKSGATRDAERLIFDSIMKQK